MELEEGKTFRDHITEYQSRAKDDQIHRIVTVLGIDKDKLCAMMAIRITDKNINEFGRFDTLKATVDKKKSKSVFRSDRGQEHHTAEDPDEDR